MKILNLLKSTNNKNIRIVIGFICLVLLSFNILSTVWNNPENYFKFNYWQNFKSLEHRFLDSQYVNKHAIWIRDEVAFSYSGGKLITGTNPVLVVPDAPPLGKYLIGLSTILFNNENIIILVFSILTLFFIYLLGLTIFKNKLVSVIPAVLFSFEPIFKNQLIYTPLLDLFQLVFILASFYFFNLGINGKKKYINFILASLFLGFFIATKFFITGFVVIGAFTLVLIYNKKIGDLKKLIITVPISVLVLLFSYARVFAFGYTIFKFLGIQKWVFLYHKSFLILPLSVWPLILFNKWFVWFGDKPVIPDSQWLITWPILTISSIILCILYVLGKTKKNLSLEILFAWFICYMAFLSFGQVFSRYFIILIPMLYIITLYGIIELIKKYENSN